MKKTGKIIGHRGAAGTALENTLASFEAALAYGVDYVELDVRLTRDNKVVVIHDKHTGRVSPVEVVIRKITLAELRHVTLHNKQKVPTLDEALTLLEDVPVMIDIKSKNITPHLVKVLARHPKVRVRFASFHHQELAALRKINSRAAIYALEHYSPLEIIQNARQLRANGIGLNAWLLNPLTYYLARRYKLDMYVYTVDHPLVGAFIKLFYPHVHICSNHPERFIKKSKKR